jgi:hypothetical protein
MMTPHCTYTGTLSAHTEHATTYHWHIYHTPVSCSLMPHYWRLFFLLFSTLKIDQSFSDFDNYYSLGVSWRLLSIVFVGGAARRALTGAVVMISRGLLDAHLLSTVVTCIVCMCGVCCVW